MACASLLRNLQRNATQTLQALLVQGQQGRDVVTGDDPYSDISTKVTPVRAPEAASWSVLILGAYAVTAALLYMVVTNIFMQTPESAAFEAALAVVREDFRVSLHLGDSIKGGSCLLLHSCQARRRRHDVRRMSCGIDSLIQACQRDCSCLFDRSSYCTFYCQACQHGCSCPFPCLTATQSMLWTPRIARIPCDVPLKCDTTQHSMQVMVVREGQQIARRATTSHTGYTKTRKACSMSRSATLSSPY